ncbi:hypothetical protein FLAT13_02434 [Flavobacterium salmonis]|uniref:Uncharacterized protein n=1 Tax=Flavobacterium salmonis TaxID=2654844 RepID=A0A6V6YZ80_9FLAO|nr:hypothetical protein FLAT13_02434 [Flavobacterium salmonis]
MNLSLLLMTAKKNSRKNDFKISYNAFNRIYLLFVDFFFHFVFFDTKREIIKKINLLE